MIRHSIRSAVLGTLCALCLGPVGALAEPSKADLSHDLRRLAKPLDAAEFSPWSSPGLLPEGYLEKDLEESMLGGLNYTAQFEATASLGPDALLLIETAADDGQQVPLTVSIGDGVAWRNAIVPSGPDGLRVLEIGRALADLEARWPTKPAGTFAVRLISGAQFKAHLVGSEEPVVELSVSEPTATTAPASEAATSHTKQLVKIPDCCGPGLGSGVLTSVSLTGSSGASVRAWAFMAVIHGSCQGFPLANCTGRYVLNVDYPNLGDAFHQADVGASPFCAWFADLSAPFPWPTCTTSTALTVLKTVNTNSAACTGPQTHAWNDMIAVMYDSQAIGQAIATSGCQAGATWLVQQ